MPNVALTKQMQEYVDRQIAAGVYGSASEVMRAGLRRLMEDDGAVAYELLRKELEAAFASGSAKELDLDKLLARDGRTGFE